VDPDRDPLGSPEDALRAIGYRTVDLLVDSCPTRISQGVETTRGVRRPSTSTAYEHATAGMQGGWGDTGMFDAETVQRLPRFRALDAAALEVVVKLARERVARI
jgi:hypothetical protein